MKTTLTKAPLKPLHSIPVPGSMDTWTTHSDAQVRHVAAPALKLAVIGNCLATDQELEAALEEVRLGHWHKLTAWPGSYLVVATQPNATVVIGDLAGFQRVYYRTYEHGLMWATAATPLAALINTQPSISLLSLEVTVNHVHPYANGTPFPGIFAVAPGQLLTIRGGMPTIQRWFRPDTSATFGSTAEQLKVALPDAVKRRLIVAGSSLTASYSGGVDSSSLAVLAAQEGQITGITYTDGAINNEDLDYARAIKDEYPNLSHEVVIGGSDDLILSRYIKAPDDLPRTDLPDSCIATLESNALILNRAVALGSKHHLTGDGGDNVFYASRLSPITMYNAGRKLGALKWMVGRARMQDTWAHKTVLAMMRLRHTTYAEALCQAAAAISDGKVSPNRLEAWERISWCLPTAGASWLTSAGAEEIARILLQQAADDNDPMAPAERQSWHDMHWLASQLAAMKELARSLGITVHTPFLDNRIITLGLSLPGWQREPHGTFKPLITEGLKDMLPEKLVTRRTKGSTNTTIQRGYQAHASVLFEFVETSQLIREGLFEKEAVRRNVQMLVDGINISARSLFTLIGREIWLRNLKLNRSCWWRENDAHQG